MYVWYIIDAVAAVQYRTISSVLLIVDVDVIYFYPWLLSWPCDDGSIKQTNQCTSILYIIIIIALPLGCVATDQVVWILMIIWSIWAMNHEHESYDHECWNNFIVHLLYPCVTENSRYRQLQCILHSPIIDFFYLSIYLVVLFCHILQYTTPSWSHSTICLIILHLICWRYYYIESNGTTKREKEGKKEREKEREDTFFLDILLVVLAGCELRKVKWFIL